MNESKNARELKDALITGFMSRWTLGASRILAEEILPIIDAYVAERVREAQAEMTQRASDFARPRGHENTMCLCDVCNRASGILALSPDPNYRKRIELDAAIQSANICLNVVVVSGAVPSSFRRSQTLSAIRTHLGDLYRERDLLDKKPEVSK